jgi:hypothetical protein
MRFRSLLRPAAALGRAALIIAAALCLACASCSSKTVTGFPWKGSSGASLSFGQSISRPEGAEGCFTQKDAADRYILHKALNVESGDSLVLDLHSASAQSKARIALSSHPGGFPPFASASFPLRAERTRLVVPFASKARIASLSLTAEGGSFDLESIAVERAFRGIDQRSSPLRVSAGFSLATLGGGQELSIETPFAGLGSQGASSTRPGLLLSYGPAPYGSALRIRAYLTSGQERTFKLRCRPSGTTTVLDEGIIPADAESVALSAPKGVAIEAFYSGELLPSDYELADLGRILLTNAPISEYEVYRWDMLPSVLVFDFKDYAAQDRFMKRLAFFVEKIGHRGALAKDEEIAPLHGWNAHDYRAEDLAAFFQAVKKKSFPINESEKELRRILLNSGVIKEEGDTIKAGEGAIISIARETADQLRWTLATHESTHGIFFADADYRRFAQALWASVDPGEKWFWRTYLGWAGYDVGSDYLLGNEFQAYLLQQPSNAAREYFEKRKSAELLEKHPEMQEKVAAYMAQYGDSFEARAKQLESWLNTKYAVGAGRTVFLTRVRQ